MRRVAKVGDILDEGAVAVEEDRAPAAHSRSACSRKADHERTVLRQGPRVEQHAPATHPRDRGARPSGDGARVRPLRATGIERHQRRRQGRTGERAAADRGLARLERRTELGGHRPRQPRRPMLQLRSVSVSMRRTGTARDGASGVVVKARVASRAASVSLSARSARASGILPAGATRSRPPDDASGLRAAEELVAAEEHEARAGRESIHDSGLGGRVPTAPGRPAGRCPHRRCRGRRFSAASAASSDGSADATNPRCSKLDRWTLRTAPVDWSSAAR